MEVIARDTESLKRLSGEIHDAWLETADIRFDSDQQVVEIPIRREKQDGHKVIKRFLFAKKYSVPIVRSTLLIANVQSKEIQDTANIGLYDIEGIRYECDSVIISSMVPLTITLRVGGLDVSLVDTDEVIEEKTRWMLWKM